MKRLLAFLFALPLLSSGQSVEFGLEAGTNFSLIPEYREKPQVYSPSTGYSSYYGGSTLVESYSGRPSFELGAKWRLTFPDKGFIQLGGSLRHTRYLREAWIDFVEQQVIVGDFYDPARPQGFPAIIGWNVADEQYGPTVIQYPDIATINPGVTNILSLNFPVLFGKEFLGSKLKISAGMSLGFILTGSQVSTIGGGIYSVTTGYYYPPPKYHEFNRGDFESVQANGMAEVAYSFLKRAAVTIGYQHGLRPIYDSEKIKTPAYYRGVSLGLSYSIKN